MKIRRMKIRHVYTVVRESDIKPSKLKQEIDSLGHMHDEVGEFLYDFGGKETITVKMQIQDSLGYWVDV